MGVKQKPWRQLRPSEPARRLAEARRGEIQQRQSLEQRNVGHVRVQRGDQLLGRVQFELRDPRIGPERRFALGPVGRTVPARPADARCRAASAEIRSRAADRSRPPPTAASPICRRTPHELRNANARRVHERMDDSSARGTDRAPTARSSSRRSQAAAPVAGAAPPAPPDRSARRRRW